MVPWVSVLTNHLHAWLWTLTLNKLWDPTVKQPPNCSPVSSVLQTYWVSWDRIPTERSEKGLMPVPWPRELQTPAGASPPSPSTKWHRHHCLGCCEWTCCLPLRVLTKATSIPAVFFYLCLHVSLLLVFFIQIFTHLQTVNQQNPWFSQAKMNQFINTAEIWVPLYTRH